ncbi:MAG: hypothetical protein F6K18_30060 [Okeania sp. SIO2C2]|uniref:ParE family toxin-like protein n=1 Tax=Okeania sp. SIO2C2 TaxID=2607787 RepID=UPI0013B6801C|nr:hypothetical protein [Okeania sp. SIO2C2]NEP90717.1 hypothetical protein [Okeania sp. SIO2C2]
MNSQTTSKFWKAFNQLPESIQETAKEIYQLWQKDPYNSSLQFKKIHPIKPIYSVRIGLNWRAVGIKDSNTIIWFWIGSHSDYNQLISQL